MISVTWLVEAPGVEHCSLLGSTVDLEARGVGDGTIAEGLGRAGSAAAIVAVGHCMLRPTASSNPCSLSV